MKRSGGVSGAVSLVMIFCVLCLAVFSVLTLAAADREARLSEMTAKSATEYYRADHDATVIAAALNTGAALSANMDVEVLRDGGTASFRLPVGESLELDVALSDDGKILHWQTVYAGDWAPDEFLNLWDGD